MIIPAGYRILVRPDVLENETESGLILARDERLERARQQRGEVLAVGDIAFKAFGYKQSGERWVEPGDRILFVEYSGATVVDKCVDDEGHIHETEYRLLNDEDVMAKINTELPEYYEEDRKRKQKIEDDKNKRLELERAHDRSLERAKPRPGNKSPAFVIK